MRSSTGSQIMDVFLGVKLDSYYRCACEISFYMADFSLQVSGIIQCYGTIIYVIKHLMNIAESLAHPKISSWFMTQGRFDVPRL